jgi:hypothetical protein
VLVVEGYEFTPVEVAAEGPEGDRDILVYGANSFAEMGTDMRKVAGKVGKAADDGQVKTTAPLSPGESAGPVFTAEGKLAGFLAAKTDALAEGGGPDRLIVLSERDSMVRAAQRSYGGYAEYGYVKEKSPETRPAPGRAFIILAIFGEKFE